MGQVPHRASITGVSIAERCEISTVEENDFSTGQFVRITDLGSYMPVPRGMDQIDDRLFLIEVTGTQSFLIKDPITHEYINSLSFTPWVEGGQASLDNTTFFYEP